MKTCYKAVSLLAITVFMLSCTEEEAEPFAAINEVQLHGRWEIVIARFDYYDAEGELSYSAGAQSGERGGMYETWITFNADRTFLHRDAAGTHQGLMLQDILPSEGQWELRDNNRVINLSTYAITGQVDWQVTSFSSSRMSIMYTSTDASGKKTDHIIEMVK